MRFSRGVCSVHFRLTDANFLILKLVAMAWRGSRPACSRTAAGNGCWCDSVLRLVNRILCGVCLYLRMLSVGYQLIFV